MPRPLKERTPPYRIALAKTEIAPDPNVSAVLHRWVEQCRALRHGPTTWIKTPICHLFTRRRYGAPIMSAAVTC